jgi:hypothetical protein
MIVITSIVIFSATLPIFATNEAPLSYWKFNGNLEDSGSLNVKLLNTYPIYTCNNYVMTFCFDSHDPLLGKINFTSTQFNKGIHFNGKSYLTSGFENESKYDFLNSKHQFTIETWITPSRLCIAETCYHHYFISKTQSFPPTKMSFGNVQGFACGIQRDGSFYCYFKNPYEYLHIETLINYADDLPKHLTIVHNGEGTYNGFSFYVNGELVKKKDSDYYDIQTLRLEHQTVNNQPLVLGNYWIRNINPLTNSTLDDLKIYDYARTTEQIEFDYDNDINKLK